MHPRLTTAAFLAVPLLLSSPAVAQCGGQGNISLEITTVGGGPIAPGAQLSLRVAGAPGMHTCVACDSDPGPVTLPGFGTFCIGMGPNLVEVAFVLPQSGMASATACLPNVLPATSLYCVAFGLDPAAPRSVAVSNSTCLFLGGACTSGGHREVAYSTVFAGAGGGPWQVTSALGGQQGQPLGQTRITFDPARPMRLPVTDDGIVYIESVALVNGELHVASSSRSDVLTGSKPAGRLPNESTFAITVDGVAHSARVHTSCSQPLTAGMVFGPITIMRVTPAKHQSP